MGVEIERKFLLRDSSWRPYPHQLIEIVQGYLSNDPTVRIRTEHIHPNLHTGLLTIKGRPTGITRPEFEYEIPYRDAMFMLEHMCNQTVSKDRLVFLESNKTWYLDIFKGMNQGLIIAEIELENEQEQFVFPNWLGNEITNEAKYLNVNLSINPYTLW